MSSRFLAAEHREAESRESSKSQHDTSRKGGSGALPLKSWGAHLPWLQVPGKTARSRKRCTFRCTYKCNFCYT